jgi:DNA-binding winged helix-turn-helix (wHTH) protein
MAGLVFQINDWILIVDENRLCRSTKSLTLEPRLVNLLCFLAQHPQQVFSRDALIEQVWSGAFVSEQVVTQSIFELRKLLKDGDSHAPMVIATVPKRGYQLVAEVVVLSITSEVMNKVNAASFINKSLTPIDDLLPFSSPLLAAPASQALLAHQQESVNQKKWWRISSHWLLVLVVLFVFIWQVVPTMSVLSTSDPIEPNAIGIEIPAQASLSLRGFAVALQMRLSSELNKPIRLFVGNQSSLQTMGIRIAIMAQKGDAPYLDVVDSLTDHIRWQGLAKGKWWTDLARNLHFSPQSAFLSADLWSSVGAWSRFDVVAIEQGMVALEHAMPSENKAALSLLLESEKVALLHHGLLTPQWRLMADRLGSPTLNLLSSKSFPWVSLASQLRRIYLSNEGDSTFILTQCDSPWAWIVKGKQSELLGQSQRAQQDYAQAYYLFPDPVIWRLSQSLAFYSKLALLPQS